MRIWKQHADLETVNAWAAHTLLQTIDIRIENESGELTCIARLTMAVVSGEAFALRK